MCSAACIPTCQNQSQNSQMRPFAECDNWRPCSIKLCQLVTGSPKLCSSSWTLQGCCVHAALASKRIQLCTLRKPSSSGSNHEFLGLFPAQERPKLGSKWGLNLFLGCCESCSFFGAPTKMTTSRATKVKINLQDWVRMLCDLSPITRGNF